MTMLKRTSARGLEIRQDDEEASIASSVSSQFESASDSEASSQCSSISGNRAADFMEGDQFDLEDAKKKQKKEKDEIKRLSEAETNKLIAWRSLVMLLLFTSIGVVTWLAYTLVKNEEERVFRASFATFVSTTVERAVLDMDALFHHMDAMASMVGALVASRNLEWPYVSLPRFESFSTRESSYENVHFFAPFVTNANLLGWERFVSDSHGDILPTPVFRYGEGGIKIAYSSADVRAYPAVPLWQAAPFLDASKQNYDLLGNLSEENKEKITTTTVATIVTGEDVTDMITALFPSFEGQHVALVVQPVVDDSSQPVGVIMAVLDWDVFLENVVVADYKSVHVVLQNTCGDDMVFYMEEGDLTYYGDSEDFALTKPSIRGRPVPVDSNEVADETPSQGIFYELPHGLGKIDAPETTCVFSVNIHAAHDSESSAGIRVAATFAALVGAALLGIVIVVARYNQTVELKHLKITDAAVRARAIVSSFFPKFHEDMVEIEAPTRKKKKLLGVQSFLESGDHLLESNDSSGQPLAEYVQNTTILFGDIVGFTAWSSTREPSQVFLLLEKVFLAFDEIAKRRGVFKVETVGDCYVAVTGLPKPRKDHCVAMIRFAVDCMAKLDELTKDLEVQLGPDTAELKMRFGIHSGAVTAGVLRGERSRFQLFGDTMNTASRIETSGLGGRIQLSQESADILLENGKRHWIKKREDLVNAKGKGKIQTYWLDMKTDLGATTHHSKGNRGETKIAPKSFQSNLENMESRSDGQMNKVDKVDLLLDEKATRLIDWNVDVLSKLIRQIMIRRQNMSLATNKSDHKRFRRSTLRPTPSASGTVLDEVKEVIMLPDFDADVAECRVPEAGEANLPEIVVAQLFEYVLTIASMYRDNGFHNFEHASHVVMSVVKLMARIVAPSNRDNEHKPVGPINTNQELASTLHDHTYGITSDPLTQFACVFSALIHDVDHTGVPNTQLMKENQKLAKLYKDRSVAEQNSVDLAWNLLMQDSYADLRACIYQDQAEMIRFRELVVNSVMATDIMDKDLKALRNARWDKAFKESSTGSTVAARQNRNRKATIVIEHLIQASDVSHTMQHWHIYRKWNERLFLEMYTAYKMGRAATNPADNWYKGEIGFFDFYIIPLAKKLKDCGVFGVSSDEYLNYAMKNRKEWEAKGQEVVNEMIEKITKEFEAKTAKNTEPKAVSGPVHQTPEPEPVRPAPPRKPAMVESRNSSTRSGMADPDEVPLKDIMRRVAPPPQRVPSPPKEMVSPPESAPSTPSTQASSDRQNISQHTTSSSFLFI